MDPKNQALQQAFQGVTDPQVLRELAEYQASGTVPRNPQALMRINQALIANGMPALTPQTNTAVSPFANGVGDPANRQANQVAQQAVTATTGSNVATPAQQVASGTRPPGPSQPNDPSNPNALPSSSAPPTQVPLATPTPTVSAVPTGVADQGNLQNLTLTTDQNFAFEKMMSMLGLGPGNRGAFGTSIGKTLLPLFQAYLGLGGLQGDTPGNMMDNASKSVNGFAGLVGGAQGLMGQLQDYAGNTIGNISKYGDKLSDPHEQQRYMDMATALSTAGDNPLIRQAMADENTRAQYGFDEAAYNGLGTPTGPKSYIEWLKNQGTTGGGAGYSDIIRLFGGK